MKKLNTKNVVSPPPPPPSPFKKVSKLCLTKVNDGLIDMDRDSKVTFVFLEGKLKTFIYILVFFGNSQIKIKIVRISNHTLKVLSWLKKILGKIEENYSSKVREIVSYNDSKPAKFFLRLFQNLTYFSAFCVIILVE